MNNAVFGKGMKNVRNHEDVNLAVTKKIKSQKKYLVLEPDWHTRNFLSEYLLGIKIKKAVYFALKILQVTEIVMHKFLFDYVKLKFGGKAKLCFMNKDSSIIYIKTKILP